VGTAKHVLLKFVKAKRTGEARSKLMVRDLTQVGNWLRENYATRRTLDNVCKMFSARQVKNESIASWGNQIDELQTDLREAARRVCKPEI
jgi:hypothetical protein